jgi:pimeloyl-ACP methyl ester carboxylesterase
VRRLPQRAVGRRPPLSASPLATGSAPTSVRSTSCAAADESRPLAAGIPRPALALRLCVAATLIGSGQLDAQPPAPPGAWSPEAASVVAAGASLHGTLLVPQVPAPKLPAALIIAGSGPTDRDGNSPALPGSNDALRLLAEGLAAEGIASLRYDKRGIGQSAAAGSSERDLRFETLVDDAAAWLDHLRADPRFGSVIVIGHSEGSLIGMLAARRAGASGFVSIAGAGRPAAEILRAQLAGRLPPGLTDWAERAMRELEAGRTIEDVPTELAALFRPAVQPYLISWFRYDPAVELARLTIPVLIAQGTTDVQTTVEDGRRLAAGAPHARLLVIEGMNHVLKLVPADGRAQVRSYSDPSLPVAAALIAGIVELVRSAR